MSSAFWKSVLISPVALSVSLLLASGSIATPIRDNPKGVVPISVAAGEATPTNSAEVATDAVKPGDWQYTALQGVAAKYGCDSNLTNQSVSQLEFARVLNTCLAKVEPLLAQQSPTQSSPTQSSPTQPGTQKPPAVTAADLEVIKRLTQEYRAQLTEIDLRLTGADKKIAQAQANQFSTTTKLKGEVIFNLAGTTSGATSNNTVLGDRVRLLFETSFNGQDRLWTRLATGNQPGVNGNFTNGATGEGAQVSEGIPFTNGNTVGIDWLAYQFPVSNTNVYLAAFNGIHVDYAPSYSPNFEDFTGGNGALSSFAESSPIYKIGGGAGIGTSLPVSDSGLTSVTLGYFAGATSANRPVAGQGLFNGDYSLLGQLNFKLSDKLDAGLTYVNSFHTAGNAIYGFGGPGGLTGTGFANTNPANTPATPNGITANSYGAQFAFKASDSLAFNGFVMNTNANKAAVGKQDIWSYGAGVSVPNIDGKGGLAGLLVGTEPYVGGQGTVPYHIEGFYKYKFSDNLSITPGLIYLTAPNQTSGNSALIGVVRSTFTF
jgi:Carbohydrate-selective porin, OprB family